MEAQGMHDPIAPSVAHDPAEAVELVAQAVSDGDLEAALAQFEDRAVLRPWAAAPTGGQASTERVLSELMDLRLPLAVRVRDVVPAGELALVIGERSIKGVAADCEPVELGGIGATLVRRQPGGGWLITADAWRLAPPDGGPPDGGRAA
jgi:ketosteroid isomerase-like protein